MRAWGDEGVKRGLGEVLGVLEGLSGSWIGYRGTGRGSDMRTTTINTIPISMNKTKTLHPSLLPLAVLAFATNSSPAQGSAGSYGQATNQCSYHLSKSPIYRLGCRAMHSGDRVLFINKHKSCQRYPADSGEPTGDSKIYRFRYAGEKRIANTDINAKIC